MKIKYSALVSDMSGKLNGSVATKNRYGSYLRNKVTPINRKTSFQLAVRAFFTLVAQAWRGLTAPQRAQWNSGASNFTRSNIFGDIRNLSGFNLYMRLNQNLKNIGQAMITVCPLPVSVASAVLASIDIAAGAQTVEIATADPIEVGTICVVSATPGLSAGKEFVASEFRQIAIIDSTEILPFDASGAYIAKFGVVPAAGTKVFVQIKSISKATGIPGSISQLEAIVVA